MNKFVLTDIFISKIFVDNYKNLLRTINIDKY